MAPARFAPLITTPWAYASELPQIRSIIYRLGPNVPPATDRRQQAADLLEAWKMRGRLPHAMDATCLLLNAILNAERAEVTALSARSVYAVAWARFVTGFCDGGKEASYTGKSMFKVAKEIDMPLHFVELRHEIAHDSLPSLQRLASAALQGMDWLWSHFWADLDGYSTLPSLQIPVVDANKTIDEALAEFRRARKDEIRDTGSEAPDTTASEICATALSSAIGRPKSGVEHVVTALVKISHLVPKKRQLGSSMEFAFSFWDPLLLGLAMRVPDFAPALLRHMVQLTVRDTSLDTSLDAFREAVRDWMTHVLSSAQWSRVRARHHEAMCGDALRVCHGAPAALAEDVVRQVLDAGSAGLFHETQQRIFTPPPPLLRPTSQGPSKRQRL